MAATAAGIRSTVAAAADTAATVDIISTVAAAAATVVATAVTAAATAALATAAWAALLRRHGRRCYGGMGTMGAPIVPNTGTILPSTTTPSTTTPSTGGKKTMLDTSAPAFLVVSVPAGARLSIGGEATTSTATPRVFVSPALNFGRDYLYTVQVEFQKDGKTVKVSKEVAVKAGEETRINFTNEVAAAVASR